jgi:integrase
MTGHLRQRSPGSWEIKFDAGADPVTGKRKTRYVTVKGGKKAAQAELRRLLSAVDEGRDVEPSKTTLAEYLGRWQRDWAALNVSPKTAERYGELMRLHVCPHIGKLPIQKLHPAHLAELYARLRREEPSRPALAARTVGHVHRVLHKALKIAVEWGICQRNPAEITKPPKAENGEIEILSEPQIRDVMAKLSDHPLHTFVRLGLGTGMRRGELLALRWRDVDLAAGKLRVELSLEQTKAGLRFKAPKTRHGRRTITLPASGIATLQAHWKAQQEHRLKLGVGKAPDDALVFCNWDGTPRSPNAVTKQWASAVSSLGLPKVSLHALRHTHASQLIASGLDVLSISRRLGHGSPTITLGVYGHLFSNTDDRAAQVIEAAFGGATE